MLFTLWGDGGAYCESDSVFAGLAFGAEHAYAGEEFDQAKLAARFEAVCGADYRAVSDAAGLDEICQYPHVPVGRSRARARMEGPQEDRPEPLARCGRSMASVFSPALADHENTTEPIDLAYACKVARFTRKNASVCPWSLDDAYAARDSSALKAVLAEGPARSRSY